MDNEPTEEELKAQEALDEQEFAASFSGEDIPAPPKEEEDPPPKEGEGDPPGEEEPDMWEGVAPGLRAHLEERESQFNSFMQQTQSQVGRIPALQRALAAVQAGPTAESDTPSAAAIAEAVKSSEKMEALQEEFPEWGEALKEQNSLQMQKIDEKLAQFGDMSQDREAIRDELRAEFRQEMSQFRVESKHAGWQDTVKSPDFVDWAFQDGPTPDERAFRESLKEKSPEQADAVLQEMIRVYPHWWANSGSLMESDNPDDAIKLLDRYVQKDSPGNPGEAQDLSPDLPTPDKGRQNRSRLEAAVAPTGGRRTPPAEKSSDEDDFVRAFNGS